MSASPAHKVPPGGPDMITIPAGTHEYRAIVPDAGPETGADAGPRHMVLKLGRDAGFTLHLLNLSGACGRITIEAWLDQGAHLMIGGVQLADGEAMLEIATTVIHGGPDTVSRQIIRSVAAERGCVTYLGRVRVEPGADGSSAEQSVRAIVLGHQSAANARPELEILADDVRCTHGCAVGELDAMGLFYLASRGVTPEAARRLMVQAFVAEALEGAAEHLHTLVSARLDALPESAV